MLGSFSYLKFFVFTEPASSSTSTIAVTRHTAFIAEWETRHNVEVSVRLLCNAILWLYACTIGAIDIQLPGTLQISPQLSENRFYPSYSSGSILPIMCCNIYSSKSYCNHCIVQRIAKDLQCHNPCYNSKPQTLEDKIIHSQCGFELATPITSAIHCTYRMPY